MGLIPEVVEDRTADVRSGEACKRNADAALIALGSPEQPHCSDLKQIIKADVALTGIADGNRLNQFKAREHQLVSAAPRGTCR